jgi:Carboxypeptidase regulatory-like domain
MIAATVVRRAVFAAGFWLCLSLPALAQGVGAIAGTVRDESGAVMPGATVTLSSPGVIGGDQSVISDATGAYQFTRLVPSTYSVKAELQGFKTVIQEGIRVSADNTSRADLKLAVGNLEESITVAGAAPLLDTTSALNQTVMSRETLDTLPTARDIFSIARLAPSLTVGKLDVGGKDSLMNSNTVYIHGSTGAEQQFMIDGMDITSYSGGISFTVDSFAYQEINYQGGNLPAERSAAGVVSNVITKTGTNRFLGAAAFNGTNSSLQSNNLTPALKAQLLAGVPAFAKAANPNIEPGAKTLKLWESMLSYSGPVVKDRLWFVASGKLAEVDTLRVGSYNADGSQLLDDNQLRNLLGKASYAANNNNQIHFTYGWVHKGRYHQAGGPTVTQFFDTAASYYNPSRNHYQLARWTDVLSSRMVLDVAGIQHYGQTNRQFQPGLVNHGDIPRFDSVTLVNTVAPATDEINRGRRGEVAASLSWVTGNHDVKFGYQFLRTVNEKGNDSSSNFPSGFRAVYRNGVPDSVNTYNTPTLYARKTHESAYFVQDKWRTLNRLTLNLGFRFETIYGWINGKGEQLCQDQTIFIAAQCFSAVQGAPDWKSPTPRVSAVYDLRGDGRTALKFSANRYRGFVQGGTYPDLVNPIKTVSDTRPWTVCAAGQVSGCDLNGDKIAQINEFGPSTGFNLGTTNRFAPGVTWPKVDEYSGEVEQQLPGNIVTSVGFFYRKTFDQIGSRNLAVPTAGYTARTVTEVSSGKTVTVYNQDPLTRGKFDVVYDNSDVLDEHFHGVDFSAQKRMSNRWMLMGSLSLGSNATYIHGTGDLNNPNFQNGRGPEDLSIPVQAKLSGSYLLPYDIKFGGSFLHYTGWPDTNTVRVTAATTSLTQVNQDIVFEPRATTRKDDLNVVDINFGKTLSRGGGFRAEPRVEIFNLLNTGVITSRITQFGPTYGNAIEVYGGRTVKFGGNLSW